MSEIDSSKLIERKYPALTIYACQRGFVVSRIATHGGIAPYDAWAYPTFEEAARSMEHLFSLEAEEEANV